MSETIPIKKTGQLYNEAGIIPVEFKVLVKPLVINEKSTGGIILPAAVKERDEIGQIKAVLIDVGGGAFSDWPGNRNPKPGDKILIAKYAGIQVEGADGETYRIIQDKEIVAILTSED